LPSQINASNSGFGGIVSTGDSSGVLQLQAAGTTIATIQSTGLNLGSNGVVFSDASTQTAAASPFGLKNRIINGDMRIDQRNAGASVTPSSGSSYTLDRWKVYASQASKFSVQQNAGSVTPPVGFVNYAGITSLSAYSVGSTDEFDFYQVIEGFNTADLQWGTANAKTVTLSFWVRSSLTGTFGGVIYNSGNTRNYPFSYSISSANTWTQISVTIAGDTTGTWLTTNGAGIAVLFSLGAGSSILGTAGAWTTTAVSGATGQTSVVGTNGATFYITGVQLEIGTSATPFERRLYNQELANCQRYLPAVLTASGASDVYMGQAFSTTQAVVSIPLPVTARVPPTGVTVNGTYSLLNSSGGAINITSLTFNRAGQNSVGLSSTVASGLTGGNGTWFICPASGSLLFTGCEL
jgi:hypothetical protein